MPFSTQCAKCKHARKEGGCDAFPDGIPFIILEGNFNHEKPYPGDNGIQFEPREE
jgi:hypothetical protein